MVVCDSHGALFDAVKKMKCGEGYLFAAQFMKNSVFQDKMIKRDEPMLAMLGLSVEDYREKVECFQGNAPWLICHDCVLRLQLGKADLDIAHSAAQQWWRDRLTPGHEPGRERGDSAEPRQDNVGDECAELVNPNEVQQDRIFFACPSCKQRFKVCSSKAGRKTRCRVCGTALSVPTVRDETEVQETPLEPGAASIGLGRPPSKATTLLYSPQTISIDGVKFSIARNMRELIEIIEKENRGVLSVRNERYSKIASELDSKLFVRFGTASRQYQAMSSLRLWCKCGRCLPSEDQARLAERYSSQGLGINAEPRYEELSKHCACPSCYSTESWLVYRSQTRPD